MMVEPHGAIAVVGQIGDDGIHRDVGGVVLYLFGIGEVDDVNPLDGGEQDRTYQAVPIGACNETHENLPVET